MISRHWVPLGRLPTWRHCHPQIWYHVSKQRLTGSYSIWWNDSTRLRLPLVHKKCTELTRLGCVFCLKGHYLTPHFVVVFVVPISAIDQLGDFGGSRVRAVNPYPALDDRQTTVHPNLKQLTHMWITNTECARTHGVSAQCCRWTAAPAPRTSQSCANLNVRAGNKARSSVSGTSCVTGKWA